MLNLNFLNLNPLLMFFIFSPIILNSVVHTQVNTNETIKIHKTHCEFEVSDVGFYNFTPLTRKEDINITNVHNNETINIKLQLCSPLVQKCNQTEGYHICISKNDKEIGIGKHPSTISHRSDGILFEFIGDANDSNYTVRLLMVCLQASQNNSSLETYPVNLDARNETLYQLIWNTTTACPMISHNNSCQIINPETNFKVDLQSLMNKDYNIDANRTNFKFRVCQSYGGSKCNVDTGICLEKNKTSYGKANDRLHWKNVGAYLNYTEGDVCENGQQRYTLILFFCQTNTSKLYDTIVYPCTLVVYWYTTLVCEQHCTTNNNEIDLSSLIKTDNNYVIKEKDKIFHINICRPLVPIPNQICDIGSAGCELILDQNNQVVNRTDLGFVGKGPMIDDKNNTILRYEGGSVCPESKNTNISTNLIFQCDYDTPKGTPTYKSYGNCIHTFEWKTVIGCKQILGTWIEPCKIINEMFDWKFDLSLLYEKGIYQVGSDNEKYTLNICGDRKYCNGSSICKGSKNYKSTPQVFLDHGNNIRLLYTYEKECNGDVLRMEVNIICDQSLGIGEPQLKETACNIKFEWHTNVTCNYTNTSNKPKSTGGSSNSYSRFGIAISSIIGIICIILVIFYFRHPERRARLRFCPRSSNSTRRFDGRVQYCKVNTTEEARLLLDTSDPTQCQTDSDDDPLST